MTLHWTGRGEWLRDPAWRQSEDDNRAEDHDDEWVTCATCGSECNLAYGPDCDVCFAQLVTDEELVKGWAYGA